MVIPADDSTRSTPQPDDGLASNKAVAVGTGRRFPRKRTGCLTCRSRKKKCDERRPRCLACGRNRLVCVFPSTSLTGQACVGTESHPLVAGHVLSLRLSWPLAHSMASTRPPKNIASSPFTAQLLQHFCDRSASVLSAVRGPDNPFVALLLPIAMSSDLVLHALLALSGVHHPNLKTTQVLQVSTWFHLDAALRGLRSALQRWSLGRDHNILPVLVAVMLLCILDTIRGDVSGAVTNHLVAVQQLRKVYHGSSQHDARVCAFIQEYHLYSDTLSRTTGHDITLMQLGIQNGCHDDDDHCPDLEPFPGRGAFCGVAQSLYPNIRDAMAAIRRASLEQNANASISIPIHADLMHFHGLIRGWTVDTTSSPPEFVICARLYQEATCLSLSKAIAYHNSLVGVKWSKSGSKSLDLDPSCFISLLGQLTISSPISQTLCWPLAVVGCCADQASHRTTILQTLGEIYQELGIGNASIIQTWLLEEVWQAGRRGLHATNSAGGVVDIDALFRSRWHKNSFA